MADYPAPGPIPYESEVNENLNMPTINEVKLNYNDNNNVYSGNIETNNVNNNISPNITSSNPVTYRSKFVWYPLIFIIVFPAAGIGFSYLCFKDGKTAPGIICNIFTVVGLGMIFTLKCSSMTIDPNKGEIYVKTGKIYKCQKNTYKIDDVVEINIRESQYIRSNMDIFYDIVLVFNDGRNIPALLRSDKNGDSINICNSLRNILPPRIQIINYLAQRQPFIENY